MKVYLDTNVLASAVAARGLSADVVRLVIAEHELLTGVVNLVELQRVLRDKLHAPARTIRELDAVLRSHTIVPQPAKVLDVPVRDPDDRWVLASALAGAADVLVTGDRDLLDLGAQAPLPIVDPRGFWELIHRPR
ncbi:MAG TPA: putative toxin-antitoxin system toxin component, PIN family [Steroidobacteraceae bacterium]|nr:putative toxin-antitoxin system toxin component, PIN family [Steroidobacteraceae bacterium]